MEPDLCMLKVCRNSPRSGIFIPSPFNEGVKELKCLSGPVSELLRQLFQRFFSTFFLKFLQNIVCLMRQISGSLRFLPPNLKNSLLLHLSPAFLFFPLRPLSPTSLAFFPLYLFELTPSPTPLSTSRSPLYFSSCLYPVTPAAVGAAGFVASEQYRLCASSPCCLPSPC